MSVPVTIASPGWVNQLTQSRPSEQRIGNNLILLQPDSPLSQQLEQIKDNGCDFVLLGIPEDIGPRANHGRGGADGAWNAFMQAFCNLQANQYASFKLACLGQVDCDDLMERAANIDDNTTESLERLRSLCEELDDRVEQALSAVFAAGLEPIIIGGGHNNALPILSALSAVSQSQVTAANLDPHSDFRPLEGRHSGNGFSYASANGILSGYYVLGLNEYKNSQASLAGLSEKCFRYDSYQSIWVRREKTMIDAIDEARDYLIRDMLPLGIEVDMDSIQYFPVSAYNVCGIDMHAAQQFVFEFACLPETKYLHLCEAAPKQHPAGTAHGNYEVGQGLSALVLSYLQGRSKLATEQNQ